MRREPWVYSLIPIPTRATAPVRGADDRTTCSRAFPGPCSDEAARRDSGNPRGPSPILVEAGEDDRLLASLRIHVLLQALRADFLHHALHRRIDARDAHVLR